MIKSNFFEYKYIFLSLFISYIKIGEIKMDYEQEKEWIRKIEEERNELDRNQKITNARLEGYEKGISDGEARGKAIGEAIGEARGKAIGEANNLNKNIQSMYKKGFDIETIADALETKIEYIEKIIKSNM